MEPLDDPALVVADEVIGPVRPRSRDVVVAVDPFDPAARVADEAQQLDQPALAAGVLLLEQPSGGVVAATDDDVQLAVGVAVVLDALEAAAAIEVVHPA